MKITVTTIIDSETLTSESKSSETISSSDIENLKDWFKLESTVNAKMFIENYKAVKLAANLNPEGWNFDFANRKLLINLLTLVNEKATTRLLFGIEKVPLMGTTPAYDKLIILIQPDITKEEFYIVSEKRGGPTGTLPTITPSPAP